MAGGSGVEPEDAHRDHGGKHMAMFLIFVAAVAVLPATVRLWRRRHPASHRLVGAGTVALLPLYCAARNGYARFVCVWAAFVGASAYIVRLATRDPLPPRAPRRVYQWLALINKAAYGASAAGAALLVLCVLNVAPGATDSEAAVEAAMLVPFYGLYFGLMSRDLVSLCSDRMAATLGFAAGGRLPTRQLPPGACGVCGGALLGEGPGPGEPVHELACGHGFHACCVRGWCVVGKRDTCPLCRENVDLARFRRHPWDRQELLYVAALEHMRFFVSWQPLALTLLTGVFWALGLE
ncbi:hypothetical protein H4R18_001758 [Coemansia javaensis]|uniref:RING-type domain-containing protein n=1 Tax=Coemansia javaensis TaxID=2761396 RepID=A0A9W8HIN6_9FUNG|nr:hypothetical protein H4R18_001758 [Coemansia javaensis]